MDQIAGTQELQGTGQLLEKVPDDDLVEGPFARIGVLGHHLSGVPM